MEQETAAAEVSTVTVTLALPPDAGR